MATLTELVEAVAKAEGVDPTTVALIARSVREAGLITTGGRGLSAARMTYRDAANLIIAVNAYQTADTAPNTVQVYRALQGRYHSFFWEGQNPEKPKVLGQFGDALETLIAAAATGTLPDVFLGTPLHKLIIAEFASSHIEIELTFHKPVPFVFLEFSTPRLDERFNPSEPIRYRKMGPSQRFSFELPRKAKLRANKNAGDKKERNSIGYATIRTVGELLRLIGTRASDVA
jgi:hypothetical protein